MDKNNVMDRIMIGMIGLFGSMICILMRKVFLLNLEGFFSQLIEGLIMTLITYVIFAVSFYVLTKEFVGFCKELWKNRLESRTEKQNET